MMLGLTVLKRRVARVVRCLAPAVWLVALAGCSATQMLYNNAPWWLESEINDYFGLNAEQRDEVGRKIKHLFAWHRDEELPLYHQAASQFASDCRDGLERAELDRFVTSIQAARDRALQKIIPDAARFLASITEEQIDRFEAGLAENLREDLDEPGHGVEQRGHRRFDDYLDRYETWYGELSADQTELLRKGLSVAPDFHAAWVKHRQMRQSELITLLRTRPPAAKIQALLRSWWNDFVAGLSPEYRTARERGWEGVYRLLVRMDKAMSPDQREHLVARIESYAGDFFALARQ